MPIQYFLDVIGLIMANGGAGKNAVSGLGSFVQYLLENRYELYAGHLGHFNAGSCLNAVSHTQTAHLKSFATSNLSSSFPLSKGQKCLQLRGADRSIVISKLLNQSRLILQKHLHTYQGVLAASSSCVSSD